MLRLQVLNACAGAVFALAVVAGMTNSASAQDCSREASLRSSPGGSASELSFRNGADAQRRVYWLDEDGQRKLHAIVEPGKTHRQPTVAAHYWVVTDAAEKCLYIITASSAPTAVEIGGVMAGATPPTPVPREAEPLVSPTAKFGLSGWYQVNSVARRGYSLNNLANGRPELEKTKPDWHSAFWQFEDVPGNQFVLIKNKWKGTYLTAAGGSVRAGSASPSSEEAHWVLEDGPYGRIKTRDGRYLIAAAAGLSLSPSASGDAGYWQLFRPGPTAERPEPVTVPRAQAEHPKVAEKAKDKGNSCRRDHVYSSSMKRCVPISATCTVGVEVYDAKARKCVTKPATKAPKGCEEGYQLVNGKCKKNAKKPGGCPPGTKPVPQTDNCVSKTDKKGFEIAPWKKPGCKGWQAACKSGNKSACTKYETTCQVN